MIGRRAEVAGHPADDAAPRIHSGVMAKGTRPRTKPGEAITVDRMAAVDPRAAQDVRDALTEARSARAEAPTIPPPRAAGEADETPAARRARLRLGSMAETWAVATETVSADLRRDPRSEK
jgi:hypothetical protein